MYKEPEAMREIHKIRERMYEETKGMTTREYLNYIHEAAKDAEKRYGLKLKKATKVK